MLCESVLNHYCSGTVSKNTPIVIVFTIVSFVFELNKINYYSSYKVPILTFVFSHSMIISSYRFLVQLMLIFRSRYVGMCPRSMATG